MLSPQYSCAFHHKICARLLLYSAHYASHGLTTHVVLPSLTLLSFCCYTFCGVAMHAAFFALPFSILFYSRYSLHLCPFFPHLKHSNSTASCLFIVLSSTSHCITLLLNISNLFWERIFPFSPSILFLQFWARCPNPLQLLHNFPLLPSSSSLSLVRACFSLGKLLINELYCCKDMVLCLCEGMEIMLILAYLQLCLLGCKIFTQLGAYCPNCKALATMT